jgi:hypothetical protein
MAVLALARQRLASADEQPAHAPTQRPRPVDLPELPGLLRRRAHLADV